MPDERLPGTSGSSSSTPRSSRCCDSRRNQARSVDRRHRGIRYPDHLCYRGRSTVTSKMRTARSVSKHTGRRAGDTLPASRCTLAIVNEQWQPRRTGSPGRAGHRRRLSGRCQRPTAKQKNCCPAARTAFRVTRRSGNRSLTRPSAPNRDFRAIGTNPGIPSRRYWLRGGYLRSARRYSRCSCTARSGRLSRSTGRRAPWPHRRCQGSQNPG